MRGLVFTLAFLGLFLLFLGLTISYAASVEVREEGLASAARLERAQLAHDNLGNVYRAFFEVSSILLAKNTTFTSLIITNRMPSTLTNDSLSLASLETFLEGTYANRTGMRLDVDTSRFSAPFIFFEGLGLNYSWNNTGRTQTFVYGNPNVTAYWVRGTLNDACKTGKCGSAGGGFNWVTCSSSTVFLRIDIIDTNGTNVKVKSKQEGCVSEGNVNDFTVEGKNGGSMTVSVGNVSGSSPAIQFENAKPLSYDSILTVNITASAPTRAWIPVLARVDGVTTLPNLVLLER